MADDDVLDVLNQVASEIGRSLAGLDDWGLIDGTHEGQYRHDVIADRVALELLDRAGFGVLSEESDPQDLDRPITVVIDPVDGSTNASKGLPWWATSLCAVDAEGPLAAVVVNQATGTRYEAIRGAGARCDGKAISPSSSKALRGSIIASNGYPRRYFGWSQFRCMGAAALDLCAVAAGAFDAFVDCGGQSLAPWDYMGALLICTEAGASVGEAYGRDPLVLEHGPRRTIVAAATPELLAESIQARVESGPDPR